MRASVLLPVAAMCAVLGCGDPTLVSCPASEVACATACADLATDNDNCGACGQACGGGASCVAGTCVPDVANACAVNNGGCSLDATCMDMGGGPGCLCNPGFTGTGQTCAACTMCGSTQFMAAPCSPVADTVCTACSAACASESFELMPCGPFGDRVCSACTPECGAGSFEAQPCGPFADRLCVGCTMCAPNQYAITGCGGTQDTTCGDCATNCAACTGPGALCTSCDFGFVLESGMCVPMPMAICGNSVIESGELCDDGNANAGDGCSDLCQVEADNYCFGDAPSICRPGTCVVDAATALPLGPDFELDGAGTATAGGVTFSQRSMIRTTADVRYPVLIEADVVYTAADVTFAGTRGSGLRDGSAGDEPTDSLRARLSANVELATGPGTTVIATTAATFTPTPGVPYRVRFFDDGLTASVEWFNLTNLNEGVALMSPSTFHGTADRAFVGGGDMAGVTVSNLRVCSAPDVPVTAGLSAHYTAWPSWTAVRNGSDQVSQWQDVSGNDHHLDVNGTAPLFSPGLINGQHVGLDFSGGARLSSTPFALTTDVTVFAVIQHRVPDQWGAIAHHGDRDNDWSMEQNGSGSSDVLHWQTNNDNTNVDVTLVPNTTYIMTGRFDGNARFFAATAFSGTSPTPASIVDASHTITAGDKPLFVGTSDNNEASNAFIGELVYYNRALTDVERDAVIEYLRNLWRPW